MIDIKTAIEKHNKKHAQELAEIKAEIERQQAEPSYCDNPYCLNQNCEEEHI